MEDGLAIAVMILAGVVPGYCSHELAAWLIPGHPFGIFLATVTAAILGFFALISM